MSNTRRLVLVSQSPRRSELLRRCGFEFTISPVQISEIPEKNLNLTAQVRDIAERKARACLDLRIFAKGQGYLLLTADTVVVLDDQILGKPDDRSENAQYLRRLSGRTHGVITAICLVDVDSDTTLVKQETSEITFPKLSEQAIQDYVSSGDGLDKAGGYGIQNCAREFGVTYDGDYDNIVGLPVNLLERTIQENGWRIDRR